MIVEIKNGYGKNKSIYFKILYDILEQIRKLT